LQAKEKLSKMEVDITQAQTRETQIVELTQWMAEMNELLQGRLDADILAGDTPKEFEVYMYSIISTKIVAYWDIFLQLLSVWK